MDHLAASTGDFQHPLMEVREVRKRAVILISTDKGLCGALNSNLFREAAKYDTATTQFIAVGRKAAQFLARTKRKLVAEFTYNDTPPFAEAQAISKFAQDLFLKGEVDAVDILYTRFINTLTQRPEMRAVAADGLDRERSGRDARPGQRSRPRPSTGALISSSSRTRRRCWTGCCRTSLISSVSQMLLEAKASEHSARMVAMKNATDNAKQLIKDLTLEYNKLRQANITKELLEIATARHGARLTRTLAN